MPTRVRLREIPYNYTSFSDREIVIRFLGEDMWQVLSNLRSERVTGRSARMLFEILGDMWVIDRNPFLQDDLLTNRKRRQNLSAALDHRLEQIHLRAGGNPLTLQLAERTQTAIDKFREWLEEQARTRLAIKRRLHRFTAPDNIDFSGMGRVAHVTDASDWRVALPLAVLYPDTENEVRYMVQACAELGLAIIPRGGGTGYTGGVVPLHDRCVVINTEKLDELGEVTALQSEDHATTLTVVSAGAGVVTRRVAEKAEASGYVFAVDPTSQDASCIGGNIAMNAGGKKAVMWGTTLDNLLSWRMVTPDAQWLKVDRLNHNLGKIHDLDEVQFRVTRYHADGERNAGTPSIISVPGSALRKQGLGKDVTNKFLGGLPGIQKEGCDGLITSAVFVLHKQASHVQTVCLEFFGNDLKKAVPAIVETKSFIDGLEGVELSGMEHLDERYVRAVNYTTKAARTERPKMILLVDIAGEDAQQVADAANRIVSMAESRDAEGFIAVTPEARRRFWADRGSTAAIAAHTNAFKINEDVVIPLDRLADYSDGIERINIELSTENKLTMVDAVSEFLAIENLQALARDRGKTDFNINDEATLKILRGKLEAAQNQLAHARSVWQDLLDNLDTPANDKQDLFGAIDGGISFSEDDTVFSILQKRLVRISYRRSVERPLKEIFAGHDFAFIRQRLDEIHGKIRSSRLFVATHMHAGDGNVHTNIPVNSNDYQMMHKADQVVDRIMALAQSLDGVISGEHGIGITKIKYLDSGVIDAFRQYKHKVDPDDRFNPGKLGNTDVLESAYTPSLRLVEQEALILEASDLGSLNNMIKDCLRCGKCKPVCNTHVPRANLLYSPRNKILATGLLIEAFLYEEQTRRGVGVGHFAEIDDVADHCTICHKCLNPCPVNIDFGDVTVRMRTILKKNRKHRVSIGGTMAMMFLNLTGPRSITWMRTVMLRLVYPAQRLGYRIKKILRGTRRQSRPAATTGTPSTVDTVIHFIEKPLPSGLPARPMRALLGAEDNKTVSLLRNPDALGPDTSTVFYFPGCGSERLFSEVGLATLAMLYDSGVQTVLPPGYLCCGYPQHAAGREEQAKKISVQNQVLFHRVANTLNYLDIRTVITSCGTCIDQLMKYQFNKIFPGSRLMDIHEYLLENNVVMPDEGRNGVQYIYHDPCHSPMKHYGAEHVTKNLLGNTTIQSDRCCGEAGTFAATRPDIATQVRSRKLEELTVNISSGTREKKKLLTSCPACQQGLSRYRDDTGLDPEYIVVALAKARLGQNWQQDFVHAIRNGGIENVLL